MTDSTDSERAALFQAIDSPTVAALENVFNGPPVFGKSYSAQIVEILAYKCVAPSKAACAWPDCGCDPYANNVIQELVDKGWTSPSSSPAETAGERGAAQGLLPYLTDRELYDNSCITRNQLKNWVDSDYARHIAGLKHTIEFLLARLDAASSLPSADREAGQ